MEASKSDLLQSAKSHFFDTSDWDPYCDVTLTLKQGRQSDNGTKVWIDEQQCKRAFHHFMNLLNHAVYGKTVKLHGKRLQVLPVLEKGEIRARSLSKSQRGTSGRWH